MVRLHEFWMRRLKFVRLYSPDRTAPAIRSQLTLAHNALIGMSDILYLIFKLAITLWQSFDDNIRTVWHIQPDFACRKQLLTDLEFVHDAPRPSQWAWRNAAVHPGSRPLPIPRRINHRPAVGAKLRRRQQAIAVGLRGLNKGGRATRRAGSVPHRFDRVRAIRSLGEVEFRFGRNFLPPLPLDLVDMRSIEDSD